MVLSQRNKRRKLVKHQERTKKILKVQKTIGPRERETYKVRTIGLSNRSGRRNDTKVLPNL